MWFNHQWQMLCGQIAETDLVQWMAILFAVAEVLFARANKILLYPSGIISVILTIIILYKSALFAECLLNGYYLVMSIYGWWHWVKRKNHAPVPASYSTKKDWMITGGIVAVSFLLLFFLLKRFTSSTVPVWDAWVSATAWAGMWLLAERKIENWILLNISNVFAIPLLWYKHLSMYSLLTVFLFVVAVQGYYDWKKIIRVSKNKQE